MGKKVTLHEEIRDILANYWNRRTTTTKLADPVNHRGGIASATDPQSAAFVFTAAPETFPDLF